MSMRTCDVQGVSLHPCLIAGRLGCMLQMAPENQEVQISPEVADMFKAGLYVGYRKTKRHPNMRQFIFGTKNNVEVFDLSKVHAKLEEATKTSFSATIR